MIGRLTGVLAAKTPPQVLIDVNGVGYEVDVPMSSFYNLPGLGERTTLLTHFIVREDAQQLFGFLTAAERGTFRQLIKISGVGPRMALALLSGLSVAELAQAVTAQDASRLVKVPGIGKKTAERLLLELFLRNPDNVLTRDVILDRVWGMDARTSSNGVEVYVGYLRRKLGDTGSARLIDTVRGVGYVLRTAA
jgi:Holliday junction DNA helicase RuvA subunit